MKKKEPLPPEVSEYFRKLGSRIGKKYGSRGGKAAAKNMTPAQRTRRAKKASAARQGATTPEQRTAAAKKAAEARWRKATKKTALRPPASQA
jgi:hypothetical protein